MSRKNAGNKLLAYTIGHSNHDPEMFAALLKDHDIELVVDVRSSPYSKYTDHFNKDKLEAYLSKLGIHYEFMGDRLGGMPKGEEYYDRQGYVIYSRIAESDHFKQGLSRLLKLLPDSRSAIMCSEEDPNQCHRRLLITRVIFERGVEVKHIRGDGRVQSESDLRAAEESRARQMSLFGEEDQEWKSTRSVSPKRAPGNSSKP